MLDCMYSLTSKIAYILILPLPLWSSFLEYLRCRLPGYRSHFVPNKTWFTTLILCIIFKLIMQTESLQLPFLFNYCHESNIIIQNSPVIKVASKRLYWWTKLRLSAQMAKAFTWFFTCLSFKWPFSYFFPSNKNYLPEVCTLKRGPR